MTPLAARRHAGVEGARHADIAEELELPGLAPARLIDVGERAARNGARIVDEDVGALAITLDERRHGCIFRQVIGSDLDPRLRGRGLDLGLGALEIGLAARDEHDVATLLRQELRARKADALGGAGDERAAAG